MTLPRKGTRPITVANESYRYAISTSRTEDADIFRLNLTITSNGRQGAPLRVEGLFTRNYWLDFPGTREPSDYVVLTPKNVATAIKIARANGWRPKEGGPPFVLVVTEEELIGDDANDAE